MAWLGKFWRFVRKPFPSKSEWRELAIPLLWAVAAGLVFRFAFPRFEQAWIAPFAMVPFLVQLPGRSRKVAGWIGFGFGLAYFWPNLFWLNTLTYVNPAAPLGVLFMASVCALCPAFFAICVARSWHRGAIWPVLFAPSLWTAIEYIRSLSEWGFPWLYVGHTQATVPPMIQICDLTGVYGVSFVLVAVNVALARMWLWWRDRSGHVFPAFAVGLGAGLVVLNLAYGFYRLNSSPELREGDPLRVAMIQPGIDQATKLGSYDYRDAELARKLQSKMLSRYKALLVDVYNRRQDAGLPKADLYILPESAITFPYFSASQPHLDLMHEWSQLVDGPIFFGANRFAPLEGADPATDRYYTEAELYNSAWLATPEGGVMMRAYDKMHLVPFGEYGSYLDFIPGFTRYILGIGNFTPGKKVQRYEVDDARFGCVICFESCFPYLFRKYTRLGVDWMLVITNDAWYLESTGARRHQLQSVFRAIETRRPVVRVANTGISCLIDSRGRILESIPMNLQQGTAQTVEVPIHSGDGMTIYMRRFGEWFSLLCLAYSVGMMIWWLKSGRQKKETAEE